MASFKVGSGSAKVMGMLSVVIRSLFSRLICLLIEVRGKIPLLFWAMASKIIACSSLIFPGKLYVDNRGIISGGKLGHFLSREMAAF